MDKNQTKAPTREGEIEQQKKRLVKSGFLNGRARSSDCECILERVLRFPVYQGKNREFCPFWDSFADYGDTSL